MTDVPRPSAEVMKALLDSPVRFGPPTVCFRHGRPATVHRLKYPQPPSTPAVMQWAAPGPRLIMCDQCADAAEEWAEKGEP